ncbi:hypothetical protein JRQ81_019201 [Phrynocephalus forsythii]|uniref:Uncharacterized protein n=1 Tax=Phrynocephalus forsythii TaxID=171643 RepID=A0A9Q0XLG7_9SAUR|nr:hypothetical protein JRQ81_019201 [Phrynocephalus forsythii]
MATREGKGGGCRELSRRRGCAVRNQLLPRQEREESAAVQLARALPAVLARTCLGRRGRAPTKRSAGLPLQEGSGARRSGGQHPGGAQPSCLFCSVSRYYSRFSSVDAVAYA